MHWPMFDKKEGLIMASATPHTIVLRSNNRDNGMQRVHEAPCQAAVTIKPGMLLAYGTTNTVKPHAGAGLNREGNKVAVDNLWATDTTGRRHRRQLHRRADGRLYLCLTGRCAVHADRDRE